MVGWAMDSVAAKLDQAQVQTGLAKARLVLLHYAGLPTQAPVRSGIPGADLNAEA
jgi:hypothetical protein